MRTAWLGAQLAWQMWHVEPEAGRSPCRARYEPSRAIQSPALSAPPSWMIEMQRLHSQDC